MKAVIVEDESVAAQNLQRLIQKIDKNIEIIAILKSVEESIAWFSSQPAPDLVFMDIHLSDGTAFNIFNKIAVNSPIIFTTAFDQYALNAFEVNSIDYLLKPIIIKDLERAIEKYKNFNPSRTIDNEALMELFNMIQEKKSNYKSRFLIPYKDTFYSLDIEEIAFVYAENKIARIVTLNNKTYHMNSPLEEVSKQLNPGLFYRANRQFIISRKAVKELYTWFDSKLCVKLSVDTPEKIIISRANVQGFKTWYTQ